MFITRTLAKKLLEVAKEFPVVALTGPRQSGKTTLVKETFPTKKYVSLEDLDNRRFAQEDPRGFLQTYANGVIIDEVQHVPGLFSYIQGIVDKNKIPGEFILTGSQNLLLHEKITQSLAGRVAILSLLPLSVAELETAKALPSEYEDLLWKGFYPRIHESPINAQDWYSNYIQTYVERDVRMLKNITDLAAFQKFIRLCAGRIGQVVNFSSLANDAGINHNTAKSWLSILEASFIIFLLKPHHKNFNKRLIKMPKLYFFDTGLACTLLGIDSVKDLELHPQKGGVFESFAIAELIKLRTNLGLPPSVYYWRDRSGHEVDCLVDGEGGLVPVEMKAGKTISDDYFKDVDYWNKLAGNKPENSFVVYGGQTSQQRTKGRVLAWQNITEIFKRK